jgi:L-gulonate 3-dehydrogenase
MLFAAAGYQVYMYDVERKRVDDAIVDIGIQLKNLEKAGLLRGQLTVDEQHSRVHAVDSLADCLSSAFYVQVSAFLDIFPDRQQACLTSVSQSCMVRRA